MIFSWNSFDNIHIVLAEQNDLISLKSKRKNKVASRVFPCKVKFTKFACKGFLVILIMFLFFCCNQVGSWVVYYFDKYIRVLKKMFGSYARAIRSLPSLFLESHCLLSYGAARVMFYATVFYWQLLSFSPSFSLIPWKYTLAI
jgi:hypothetical protein